VGVGDVDGVIAWMKGRSGGRSGSDDAAAARATRRSGDPTGVPKPEPACPPARGERGLQERPGRAPSLSLSVSLSRRTLIAAARRLCPGWAVRRGRQRRRRLWCRRKRRWWRLRPASSPNEAPKTRRLKLKHDGCVRFFGSRRKGRVSANRPPYLEARKQFFYRNESCSG